MKRVWLLLALACCLLTAIALRPMSRSAPDTSDRRTDVPHSSSSPTLQTHDRKTGVLSGPTEGASKKYFTVNVLDAHTRKHVPNVTIIASNRSDGPCGIHPGSAAESDRVLETAASPCRVLWTSNSMTIYAMAPGYAWKCALIQDATSETTLLLRSGGSVRVRFRGEPPQTRTLVHLFIRAPWEDSEKGKYLAHLDLAETSELAIQGVPVGLWDIRAEFRTGNRRPMVESLGVGAGKLTTVDFACPEPTSASVTFEGQLEVAPEWDRKRISAVLVPRHGGSSRTPVRLWPASRIWHWHFSAGEISTGEYSFGVPELGYWQPIHVLREPTAYRVRVPPPAELSIQLLDAASGDSAPVNELAWSVASHHPFRASARVLGSNSGRFSVRSPPGLLTLESKSLTHPLTHTVQVESGRTQLTLRLPRRYCVDVRFATKNGSLPATEIAPRASITKADGSAGGRIREELTHASLKVWLADKGPYVLRFSGTAAYLPARLPITVGADNEVTRVKVMLESRP